MRWQVVNNRPLGIWLPEIVDPEAPFRIAHIATVFQVPVDDMAATIPLCFVLITPTESIADPTFYSCIAQSASSLKSAVVVLRSQPRDPSPKRRMSSPSDINAYIR